MKPISVTDPEDTIAAIATPLGEGGLAVIRISGGGALDVAGRVFTPIGEHSRKPGDATSHTIHYGRVIRDGQTLDEVLCAVMRAPRTFTREDIVEITCHGGILCTKSVLDAVLRSGARLAEPGEFTKRAFLNGRLDLAQAEAVADLIHSRTELALAAANEQLAGTLSQRINELRDQMMQTLAHVEAHIDFPDEDIAPDTKAELIGRLERGVAFMEALLRTADEGRILRRGIRAAIIGRPNAGKSSLLNQLLGHDRAIVSPIAGTTRDTIEETANIRGLPVVFVDTAGLRDSGDELEQEGVKRSRAALANAELVLHVLDASQPLTAADELYLDEFEIKKRVLVRNKMDLPVKWRTTDLERRGPSRLEAAEGAGTRTVEEPGVSIVDVSCATGQGIEALKDAIRSLVWSGEIRAEMLQVMINARHQEALNRARTAAQHTLESLRTDATLELVALDLRLAVNAVGEIVGKTSTEDLLDSIFGQFCIGK